MHSEDNTAYDVATDERISLDNGLQIKRELCVSMSFSLEIDSSRRSVEAGLGSRILGSD